MKKRALLLLLLLAFILNCGCHTITVSDNKTADATEVLLQSGWTQADIDDLMTEDALLEFANTTEAYSQEKYYRVKNDTAEEISEEQCEKEINQTEITEKSGKSASNSEQSVPLKTTAEKSGGNSYVKINLYIYNAGNREYVISARFEWLKRPIFRGTDIFTLGHSNTLDQAGTNNDVYYVFKFTSTQVDSITNTAKQVYEHVSYSPTTRNTDFGGTVITQRLFNDNVIEPGISTLYTNQRGYLQYRAVVNNKSAAYADIYAQYSHKKLSSTDDISISYKFKLTDDGLYQDAE